MSKPLRTIVMLGIGAVGGAFLSFCIQLILARKLGPADYGSFNSALLLVTITSSIAAFGVGQLWLRLFATDKAGAVKWLVPSYRFVAMNTLACLAILVLWAVFGPHDRQSTIFLLLLSPILFSRALLELLSSVYQVLQKYDYFALVQISPWAFRFVGILAALAIVQGTLLAVHATIAYGLVAFLLAIIFFRLLMLDENHRSAICSAASVSKRPGITQVAGQSWTYGLAALFSFIYMQSDIVLVRYLGSAEAAGHYSAAYTIISVVFLLPNVIYQRYLLPKIHRWIAEDKVKLMQVLRLGNILMGLLGITAGLILFFGGNWLLTFVFGNDYLASVVLLKLLAISIPVYFLSCSLGSVLVSESGIKRKVTYMGVVCILNLVLNWLMIPGYGASGAAVATIISYALLTLLYARGARAQI